MQPDAEGRILHPREGTKPIETGCGRRGQGLFPGDGVSVWEDEGVPETDGTGGGAAQL